MNRYRFTLVSAIMASSLTMPAAALSPEEGASVSSRAPSASCALVKGQPGGDGKPTYDLTGSGFKEGPVQIKSKYGRSTTSASASGAFTKKDQGYADYQVRQGNRNWVQCTKVAKTGDEDATKNKNATVASVEASIHNVNKASFVNDDYPCGAAPKPIDILAFATIVTSDAGTVKYRWIGTGKIADTDVHTINFTDSDVQQVATRIDLGVDKKGDVGLGWAQLVILGDKAKTSNRIDWHITCTS
ncbi:hypothetical protein AB0F11_13570 [Streptomyces sp. NPDC032472]|uniref:hypothetical protein n=1 Tax=Streptomyces sp. NPDC032472 TaxID=3155018 RepID=UPI003404A517